MLGKFVVETARLSMVSSFRFSYRKCFAMFCSKKSLVDKKKAEELSFTDLIGTENISINEPETIQTLEKLLSQNILQRCTPLMRKILQGASVKHLNTVEQKIKEPQQQELFQQDKHNLQYFRHMLAGPLPNEVSLDKFCLKKQCPIILDVKYDGERTLITFQQGEEVEMLSRNGKSQRISYNIIKERIQRQLLKTDIKSIKMDGQIVVVDEETMNPLPLGELLKLKNLKNEEIQDWELQLQGKKFLVYIFDVVEYNGQNLMTKPLIERRQYIPKIDIIKPVEYRLIHFPQERAKIFDFFKEVLQRKYEGLIIKGQNDLYYTNQTRTIWKKLKRGFVNTRDPNVSKVELDLIVMGANRGTGFKNNKIFTSYLMGTPYNGKVIPISNVGSGFNEEIFGQISKLVEQKKLVAQKIPEEYDLQGIKADIYYKPQLIFQIHAQQFTISPIYNLGRGQYGGLSLRFPSFKRIRQDKGLQEATTGEQIIELSKAFNFNLPK